MNDTPTLRCEICSAPMTLQARDDSPIRYHHCTGCGRWVASTYRDELCRAGTAREEKPSPAKKDKVDFEQVKARLTKWIAALEESDPYNVLGVPPSSPEETVRARYKELALANHPDRGGDPANMRRVLEAWDRIRRQRRLA